MNICKLGPLSKHITNMNSHKHSPGSIISNISKINSETNDEVINDTDNKKKMIEWSYDNEEILAEWCDIAQCYKWLNHHAHDYYSSLHAWFTIPAITFSTISGTASFASASIPIEFQSYAPMAIGTINILIGILTTIQQYLKVSELKESYRLAAISWDKYARNICIELSKSPIERIDAGTFLKFSRQEYDRLMESNQSIPPHIVAKFRRNFRGKTAEEKKRFDLIKKPDICDVIVSINEKRHMWFPNRHQDEPTETDSIDTTSTFRDYMIFKQNTINNRKIPYFVDNIPEPEQHNKRPYDRKFSKENLFKHDHLYDNNDNDNENNSTTYSEINNENTAKKIMEYNRRRSNENVNHMSAPRRHSNSSGDRRSPSELVVQRLSAPLPKDQSAPRRTSKEYAMNMKDTFFKKLFYQSPSNGEETQSTKSYSKLGRDKKIFEKETYHNDSEKTTSVSRSNTPRNKNKNDIETGLLSKSSGDIRSPSESVTKRLQGTEAHMPNSAGLCSNKATFRVSSEEAFSPLPKTPSPKHSSIRKSSSMNKMYGISDHVSETTNDSFSEPEPYDEMSLSNNNNNPRNRTRSDSHASADNYYYKNNVPREKESRSHKETPITLIPFNSLDAGKEEHNSNNSSNSSLQIKHPNKIVKRVTHESDSKSEPKVDEVGSATEGRNLAPPTAVQRRRMDNTGNKDVVEESNGENITISFQEDEDTDIRRDNRKRSEKSSDT